MSPLFNCISSLLNMIDKKELVGFIEKELEGTDFFLVDVSVSPANEITVEIDHPSGVDIDRCVLLTRAIVGRFDRDVEDYELEVGSSGLTSPFKVLEQYRKNIGNPVEVLTLGGEKLKGHLAEADSDGFTLEMEVKVRKEGQKRPVIELQQRHFGYSEVKYTKYLIEF